MNIKRATYGRFGTAVRPAVKFDGFLAWASDSGKTSSHSPLFEEGKAWFAFGDTEQEALDKLHADLTPLL